MYTKQQEVKDEKKALALLKKMVKKSPDLLDYITFTLSEWQGVGRSWGELILDSDGLRSKGHQGSENHLIPSLELIREWGLMSNELQEIWDKIKD